MGNIVEDKQITRTKRIKRTVGSQLKRKANATSPHEMTDEEWSDGMARMQDVMGRAFANVDVDDYVNSFRRSQHGLDARVPSLLCPCPVRRATRGGRCNGECSQAGSLCSQGRRRHNLFFDNHAVVADEDALGAEVLLHLVVEVLAVVGEVVDDDDGVVLEGADAAQYVAHSEVSC